MACAFGVFLGDAHAATPPSATFSSTNTSASFTGHVTVPNFLLPTCDPSMGPCVPGTSPSPCPSQAEDPGNVVCEHFTVNTLAAGIAYACVGFPPGDNGLNDIDLYVVDSNDNLVASGTTENNPECVSFPVTVGVSYEIDINPVFIEDIGGFDVSGTVTFTPTNPSPSGSTSNPLNSEMEGGGELFDGSHFHIQVAQLEPQERKIKFKTDDGNTLVSCAFKATTFDVVQVFQTGTDANGDPTGKAHLEGYGLDHKQSVHYVIDVTDGGEHGQGDSFSISLSDGCTDSGPLVHGDVDYELSH